jgi:hypothetical protein
MPHTDTNMLFSFILLLVIAALTAYYASRKGRNPLVWFIIGILLGIFAPLLLLFFPEVKKEREDNEMPTMTISPPDASLHQISQTSPTPAEFERQEEEDKLWYYLDQNHQQMGPVSVVALRELWNRGKLELNNYVWTDGMEQWEKVDNLPDLKSVLNKP